MEEKINYRFTKEQIKMASKNSIYDYVKVNSLGSIVSESGNYVKLAYMDHDTIVIDKKKNYFIHNANSYEKNAKGNLINFIQYINKNDIGFQEAVRQSLEFGKTNSKSKVIDIEEKELENFEYDYIQAKHNWTLERYLTRERKIDSEIVKYLVKENYVMQDVRNNIIFNWTRDGKAPSDDNLIVGATQQLTKKIDSDNPNKYIKKNSEKYHGFNVLIGEKADSIYAFEASIDLLSYWTMHKNELKNCRLISLEGVKDGTLFKMVAEDYTKEPRDLKVYVSVDNDKAGHIFLDNHIQSVGKTHTLEYIQNIPDYNAIEAVKCEEIINIAERYKLPKELMLAFWQFDRPLLNDKDKLSKVYREDIEQDLKVFSDLYKEKDGNQDEIFDSLGMSSRQIERILDWQTTFKSNKHILKNDIFKDWNDVLKSEVINNKQVSVQPKMENEKKIKETISDYVLRKTQRLSEQQISTISKGNKIDIDIIQMCAKKGWLRSDVENDDLYVVWGKDKQIVGANKLTNDYQIASPVTGSSIKDSLIITIGEKPKELILFEQPIDCLKYIADNRNQIDNCVLICSRDGDLTKQYTSEKVLNYLKTTSIDNIAISTKSDRGENIKNNIVTQLDFENNGNYIKNFDLNIIKSNPYLKTYEKPIVAL